MKATVNLNQILQGGLAGLVAWLFKTVNDMQQEVATLKALVSGYQNSIQDNNSQPTWTHLYMRRRNILGRSWTRLLETTTTTSCGEA